MRKFGLFIGSALLAVAAFAAPAITSFTGTALKGQTCTLAGSGFGAKTTAKPALWDDLETGDGIPSNLGNIAAYSGSGFISTTTAGCYQGSYCTTSTSGWRTSATGTHIDAALGFTARSTKFYVHFKRKTTQTVFWDSVAGRNTKNFRMWSTSNGTRPNFYTGTNQGSSSQVTWEDGDPQLTGETRFFMNIDLAQQPASSWRTEEYFITGNSAQNVADGFLQVALNNTALVSTSTVRMDSNTNPGVINYLILETVTSGNSSEQWCNSGDIQMDDIYADTGTWSRAMLCNAATFSGSSICEMQIPTAWSDTSITVKFNTGAFTEGTKYLYVCDSTNPSSCNSSGYAVTIGSDSSGSAAATATPFKISGNLRPSGNLRLR